MRGRCYVSYAWADESDPKREAKVDELCEKAKTRSVEIVRDKTTLRNGDRISDFMRQIGEGDRVFIFLSDKYLHSPYCMFELFAIWRESRQNEAELLGRVRVVSLDDAKIWDIDGRLAYASYWEEKLKKLDAELSGKRPTLLADADIRAMRLMQDFAYHVGNILALFADTVQPHTFEDFLNYGFDEPGESAAVPPPPPSSPPKPDDAGILELKTAIDEAFPVGELDKLVILTFSETLYRIYVPDELKGTFTTTDLLQILRERGFAPQFLRAVRMARPKDEALVRAIKTHCPIAMGDAPGEKETVEAVRQGLKALDQLRKERKDVNGVVAQSRETLAPLLQGLKNLQAYKALHDTLQTIQVQQYSLLVADIEKLRQDPMTQIGLLNQVTAVKSLCERAMNNAKLLPNKEFNQEIRWIRTLTAAVDELRNVIDDMKDMDARDAATEIRNAIHTEPTRLNSELVSSAESLPLENLISAFDGVTSIPGLQAERKRALDFAKAKLESLWGELRGRVSRHDHWQEVETQLCGADNEIERSSPAPDLFGIYWRKVKQKITPLWDLDPSADWVAKTQRLSSDIDMALAAAPVDFINLKVKYGRFRNGATTQFYRVDGELKSLCDEIVNLREPLTDILNG
jgi:hypothetical protein